jgi:MYXO-CTERM domain-containing protein
MAGEHWAWLVLALAAFVLRRARRKEDESILSVPIRPGERYLVSLSEPGGHADPGRRRAAHAPGT